MPQFTYWAYQTPGVKVDGSLRAESERAAAEALLRQGLQPIRIRRNEARRGARRHGQFRLPLR